MVVGQLLPFLLLPLFSTESLFHFHQRKTDRERGGVRRGSFPLQGPLTDCGSDMNIGVNLNEA